MAKQNIKAAVNKTAKNKLDGVYKCGYSGIPKLKGKSEKKKDKTPKHGML